MFTYNTTSKATAAALCSILNTSASQYGGQYTTSGKAVNGATDNTDTADQYAARLADAFRASKYTADAATLAASVPAPAPTADQNQTDTAAAAVMVYNLGLKTASETGRDILAAIVSDGRRYTSAAAVMTAASKYTADADILAAIRAELDAAPVDTTSQPAPAPAPAPAPTDTTDASQPAPAAAVMPSAADVLIIAASLIKERGTLAAIKADYKALTDQYTKKGYKAILSAAAGIRYADIDTAAAGVRAAVTYDSQLLAAYDSARTAADWAKLCQYYGAPAAPATDSKADRLAAARAFVAAYYKDTDADGAPVRRQWFVSADGRTAYLTYIPATTTATTAAAVFLAAVNNGRKAAKAAAYYGKDDTASRKAAKFRTIGHVYGVANIAVTTADGVMTISRTAATGKDGKPLTAAAIASQFAAVSVCNTDGTPTDGRRTWSDWRKDVTTDASAADASANK